MIDLIGAPFDLTGRRPGTRLGPAALRLAGLRQALEALDQSVVDHGDVQAAVEAEPAEGMKAFAEWAAALSPVKQRAAESLRSDRLPLVLGGDHSMSVASVGAALEVFGDDIALLWIDAHADLHTPCTTITGNPHGMPIAALMGVPSIDPGEAGRQWARLLAEVVPPQRLDPHHMAWFGLRELDPPEQARMAELGPGYTATMYEIDRHGIVSCLQRLDHWLTACGARHLWISFDVDALDPILAPGTGTTVRGGLTYREAHLVAEMLRELLDKPGCPYRLVGVDLMEVNPLYDSSNETAITTVEWLASLFGKTILGRRHYRTV